MTVLMTCVVIYLYTVLAFNYFRKFYIEKNSEGQLTYKCDSMAEVGIMMIFMAHCRQTTIITMSLPP